MGQPVPPIEGVPPEPGPDMLVVNGVEFELELRPKRSPYSRNVCQNPLGPP